jgi:hypothetical protein
MLPSVDGFRSARRDRSYLSRADEGGIEALAAELRAVRFMLWESS